MIRKLFQALRVYRDVKAVAKGRSPQRIWNRSVSAGWRRLRPRLYK